MGGVTPIIRALSVCIYLLVYFYCDESERTGRALLLLKVFCPHLVHMMNSMMAHLIHTMNSMFVRRGCKEDIFNMAI